LTLHDVWHTQEGAFLVRVSERDAQFPYTICVLHNGEPHNIQIRRRDDDKFALGSKKNKETVRSHDVAAVRR